MELGELAAHLRAAGFAEVSLKLAPDASPTRPQPSRVAARPATESTEQAAAEPAAASDDSGERDLFAASPFRPLDPIDLAGDTDADLVAHLRDQATAEARAVEQAAVAAFHEDARAAVALERIERARTGLERDEVAS